jgi:hypothetical protein
MYKIIPNNMKTAMQELLDYLERSGRANPISAVFKRYLEAEKHQIIKAVGYGVKEAIKLAEGIDDEALTKMGLVPSDNTGDLYYKKTYQSK